MAVHGTPLGTDFITARPPVDGMAGNVLVPAGPDGVSNGKLIVKACRNVTRARWRISTAHVPLVGPRTVQRPQGVPEAFRNIQIVATGEGAFVPDTALKAATDLLTAHEDLNVLAACCDQGALGWERAAANAGVKGKTIIGGGAGCVSIQRIKAGKWFGTTVLLPKSGAQRAAEIVIKNRPR